MWRLEREQERERESQTGAESETDIDTERDRDRGRYSDSDSDSDTLENEALIRRCMSAWACFDSFYFRKNFQFLPLRSITGCVFVNAYSKPCFKISFRGEKLISLIDTQLSCAEATLSKLKLLRAKE